MEFFSRPAHVVVRCLCKLLTEDLRDRVPVDIREPEAPALELKRELLVINAQQMQQRRVEVVKGS